MDRRSFLQNSFGGLTALVVGNAATCFGSNSLLASHNVQSLHFKITDVVKEMITHNEINEAKCYFWIFKEENFPADCPGPIIVALEDEQIDLTVTNELDEPHAFFIKGAIDTGPIPPGESFSFTFKAPKAGTYLYYDHLNAPVNRLMGLHGAFIVMPKSKRRGNKFTPYSQSTSAVQSLFNDLGNTHFPGLSWEEGDPRTKTSSFRQYVWLIHEASPILFDYPAEKFNESFLNDRYANTYETNRFNKKPHFFTINGQSGYFSHHSPYISPWRRVGEPVVIRVLNAGLYTHSLHLHANHFYITAVDNKVSSNVLWVDTFEADPLQTVDWLVPCVRPPDVPNKRGIGLADKPLVGLKGHPVWPPVEEMKLFFPKKGSPLAVQQSPLCYPMHDHIEISQTSQGGNYNMGIMAGIVFTGDRTIAKATNFPNYPHEYQVGNLRKTRSPAPPIPGSLDRDRDQDQEIPQEEDEMDHEDQRRKN
jgi:hypothetical protein